MEFEWTNVESVEDSVINNFDSGNHAFNDFIYNRAKLWNSAGEAITYVFADAEEISKQTVTRIYGFATINALGLLYDNDGRNEYLPCVEIRLFAIAKQLRKNHNPSIEWSNIIFKTLLQNLYQMSTSVIGFKAIFLNANHDGYQLYIDNDFTPIKEYVTPEVDEKIKIENCTPLLLMITDDTIYNMFL